MEQEIKKIICDQLKINIEDFNNDLAAGDISTWDSLGHINLLMRIEKHFKISFDVTDSIDIETAGDLLELTLEYIKNK